MPKSRGSGSIASISSDAINTGLAAALIGAAAAQPAASNGGGSGLIEELATRLAARIRQTGPIVVREGSSTRGGTEDIRVTFDSDNEGIATVNSGSGRTYSVDYINDSCTCMHNRIRRVRCRHISAVHQALGELGNGSPMSTTQTGMASSENVIPERQQLDLLEEEQRRTLQNVYEDDGFFYTDNDAEFQEMIRNAANQELEYDYENALNGSQNTFGLEIEFINGNADAIARELYALGICAYDHRVHYHAPSVAGKWKLERDGSVSDGDGGGELVSPVLTDTPETWRTLEKICEVAKRHGARVDQRAGGHVHMSINPLDTAKQRWKRFFKTIGGFEEVMYRLSGGTEGRIRSGYTNYARPFAERALSREASNFRMETDSDINTMAREVSNGSRYYGINLKNIYDESKPNTVELRYFNSSLDPRQLQNNVKIANGIMLAAEKARVNRHSESSETMNRRGKLLKDHSAASSSRRDHNAVRKLVDIIFTRKKDKDNILRVYAKNQWRR